MGWGGEEGQLSVMELTLASVVGGFHRCSVACKETAAAPALQLPETPAGMILQQVRPTSDSSLHW